MDEHKKDMLIVTGVIVAVIVLLIGITYWSVSRSKKQSNVILKPLNTAQPQDTTTK